VSETEASALYSQLCGCKVSTHVVMNDGVLRSVEVTGIDYCPLHSPKDSRQQFEAGWRARGEADLDAIEAACPYAYLGKVRLAIKTLLLPAAQPANEPAKEKP